MQLDQLLKDIYPGKIPAPHNKYKVQSIRDDSRKVTSQSLFIAFQGQKDNGIKFIPHAIANGAKVVVVDRASLSQEKNIPGQIPPEVCLIEVDDARTILKQIVKKFYEDPSQQLRVIGITGTNGKTTCTYLIESILKQAQKPCGVIGTINYRIGDKEFGSGNTTPGIIENQEFLWRLVTQEIGYCVMEVSSHALDQGRVDLVDFKTTVFTNLTSDHLDYHVNRENYFQAKAKLFTQQSQDSRAVVNIDDEYGQRLTPMIHANVTTYALHNPEADCYTKDFKSDLNGLRLKLLLPQGEMDIQTSLMGVHNVYNILASVATACSEKIDPDTIKRGIEGLKGVPGRLERIDGGQKFHIFVDYAHTEDALKNVLQSLKDISDAKIILVFGCGGDRDKTKRARMGQVADELADVVVLTNDNPRHEEPQVIIDKIKKGFHQKSCEVILDRQKAIGYALSIAQEGNVVLIAGKGHENYQIFGDQKVHFDDREIAQRWLDENLKKE